MDSQSLLDFLSTPNSFRGRWHSMVFQWNHVNVLHQLSLALRDLGPISLKPEHVPSHQDDKRKWQDLNR